jgi:hypothetical protein
MSDERMKLMEIHDACLEELSKPRSPDRTIAQDAVFRARLLYIIQNVNDPKEASRLFREAMEGA